MTRVLIVDDERNIHKAYCADIRAAADRYELVDTIVSAADAIMVCTAKHIDLVLMDINTAKNENGIEATKSCLLYTSPSPRDASRSRMPSSA